MTHVQKGAKYTLKNLLGKTRKENELRMKVLRYVMAVGFVLSPWLGGEAYAAGIERVDNITLPNGLDKTYLQNDSNVAHIYAEQASGDVGLNRFKTFEVGAGQIANLYFKTSATDTNHLNTLVNTVQERISISGTVNAIRNNKVGGKLYFLSPKGMVVGAGGVINAGALTVITTGVDKITTPAEAISTINSAYSNSSSLALTEHPIEIHGQINTVNGIDLRSLSIAISKDSTSGIKPYLKTGMVFETIVNTNGLIDEVKLTGERSNSTDTKIELCAYKASIDEWNDTHKQLGNITLSGCDVDALGDINIVSGESLHINNKTDNNTIINTNINTNNAISIDLEHTDTNSQYVGNFVFESGRIEAGGMPYITVGNDINIGNDATFVSTLVTNDTINFKTQKGNISNYGNIQMQSTLNMQAGQGASGGTPCLINGGTIESQGGGLSLTAKNNITNNGTIEANAQIKFAVGGTLTNQGTIESTSSNVQADIGRNFKNIAVYNNESTENRTLIGGIIEAGGNVQVKYNLDNEGIGVASSEERIDGIYNIGLIWAKGDKDPVKKPDGTVDTNSGSGNIWLTSSYNITNYGTMEAGRQITLNARDFLDNYGLIQGVTYLDIKSIMGYVYNHTTGRIISTGGNIALSSGQANLQIDGDTNGQKKEEYRKFTPIIIEGKVEATSDDDDNNQTKEGNIEIKAYLGDIYVNGATIETKPELGTNGEVKAVAGNVILDAAQNITIGFKTEQAKADDPTTQAGPNGENKDKYERDDEREYFVNTSTLSQKAAEISGSNITLISGSGKTISMSTVNNSLTASKAITINTDSMNIVGGTFNADTLEAKLAENGALNITGGTINAGNVTSNRALSISGGTVGKNYSALSIIGTGDVSIGSDAIVRTSSDMSIASDEGTVTNNSELNISGSVSLSGKTDVTNSANITASKYVSMTATTGKVNNSKVVKANGGNINLTGGTSINLQEGYGLEASDTINLTTDNMQITSGTIKANTLAASEALTLTGGTINAANISAGTNLIHNGAIITADNDVTISAGNNINLQSGRLTANGAAFVVTNCTAGANSIVESASGYNLGVGSLSLSANQGNITLKGTDNVLQSVTLADVGGNVEIVNGNDTNKNVLIVSTAEGTTVGGIIKIVNKGEGITVAGINATNNVSLTADKGIAVTGSFTTTGDVVLDADADISIAGGVNAASASFGAGVDFIHDSGAIAAGEVVVTAGQNVQLNGGSMVTAKSASLTANAGSIAEQAGYAIDAPQLTASAAKYATLGSSANQLAIVDATQVGGDLTIGSGNTKSDAALQIATAGTIQGDLTVINYASNGDAKANEIVFGNNLKATGNIVLNNQETDINIGQGLTITSVNEGVSITSAGNVNLAGTIDVKNVNITAAEAISQTAGSIVATNTVATAGSDLSLASSANKLQNVTVKADDGSVIIVSGNDKAGDLNVKTDGTIGGTLSITNVANGAENDIVIEQNLLANGSITINNQEAGINLGKDVRITSNIGGINITALKNMFSAGIIDAANGIVLEAINNILDITGGSIIAKGGSIALHGKGGINNGASITAKGNVGLYSTGGSITNSANITAGHNFASATRRAAFYSLRAVAQETEETGSVTMSGKDGVTNTANASVSAEQSVSMTYTAGSVNNSSVVTSNSGSVVISGKTGVTNKGAVTATDGSVTMSGNSVDNTANIIAGSDVSMNATTGNVQNSGTIVADQSVGITADAGTVSNSSAVTTTGGSVEISGSSVTNKGAVTATGGSVTMSGDGGVDNSANITAKDSVNISADAGAITNSSSVTSEEGNIVLTSNKGITSTGEGALLKTESLNGSISAATTYGEVNISEITAGKTASASSQSGSVIIGTVAGNDVVLTSGGSITIDTVSGNDVAISGGSNSDVNVDNITVDNSLKLQGDDITVNKVASSNTTADSKLTVDVNGAGGSGTAVKNDLVLNVDGDVVIDNLNVTKAEVTASGNIDVNKIGVDDKGQAQLTSNKKTENDSGTTVTVVGKDATPDAGSGNVIVAPGNDSDTWLKIEMNEEGSKTTVMNDPGSNDYPAQMSAKLVDYDPYDTYLDHYADMADIFSRSYLIDAPERSSSDILFPAQGGRIVLKQDANGLHLEISEEDKEA